MREFWTDAEGQCDPEAKLWRYFPTKRLVDALNTSRLYFSAATQFDDPFEGASYVALDEPSRGPSLTIGLNNVFKQWTVDTKISCWHEAELESYLMWQLYAAKARGAAIRTTHERIRRAITYFHFGSPPYPDVLWCGKIRYRDLTKVAIRNAAQPTQPPPGILKRFFYKHLPFSQEKEFRVVVDLGSHRRQIASSALPPEGVLVVVDMSELVDAIVMGPNLPAAHHKKIALAAASAGLSDRIVSSALIGRPRFI